MMLFLIILAVRAYANTGCEHCIKLCQFNFDYVPLIQDDYCAGDISCENFLREVSFRYLSGNIKTNPCVKDSFKSECWNYSIQICSEILQNPCSKRKNENENENQKYSIKNEFEEVVRQEEIIEQELKQELAREKQKYLRIINKLSELQIEISD